MARSDDACVAVNPRGARPSGVAIGKKKRISARVGSRAPVLSASNRDPVPRPSPRTDVSDPDHPQAGAVASGYASALVEACADAKALDSVHGDIETLSAYMAANPAMSTFLSNPTMEGKNKKDVLAKLGKEASFHPFTSNFLNLLVDKSRIGQLDAIAEEFESLYCAQTDTQVSEHPPPAELKSFFPFSPLFG